VWGFNKTGPKQGEVGIVGPVDCPSGTVIQAEGDEHTNKFCFADLTESGF
jgi:hypothetical protein